MSSLPILFDNNKAWAEARVAADPEYFARLSEGQSPKYLWLGCADSRVSPNLMMGLEPGEVFVHRNIANQVHHSDLSMLSVVQYAVEHLKVGHVIVCGHYGCGGVAASVDGQRHGIVDHWIQGVADVAKRHEEELSALNSAERIDRLCELNVLAQAENLRRTPIIQDAWSGGQELEIHPWIFRLDNGRVGGLGESIKS